jgi:hypothetical protein
MLKKTVKFKDFDGVEHSEDLYFHISKAAVLTAPDTVYNEIITIGRDLQEKGKYLQDVDEEVNQEDPFDKNNQLVADAIRTVARLVDRLVDLSYGIKSSDGLRFVKGPEVLVEFKASAAYDAFVEQMLTNQDEMIDFINKLLGS